MNTDKPTSELHYSFADVEAKWQKRWEESGTYKFRWDSGRPKFYVLTMFSYPSGDKLHLGHWYCYAPSDSFARFKRMQGFEVFEPMGFDAFGLPAENYAIKTGIHPRISTEKNTAFMREQLKKIGAMYDWDYELNTSTPEYYKWTQWWFLLMYKRGLAYQKQALVNWCPNCQTVLANEQVLSDNTCERCGTVVVRKNLKQWFFKITDYNQRLLDGLDTIDWPDKTKAMQRYWIGKSQGTEIEFKIQNPKSKIPNTPPVPPASGGVSDRIRVFTTRADTLFGVTWVVIAPEHPLAATIASSDRKEIVDAYIKKALAVSDVDRAMTDRPKTGVFTGSFCTHPLTGERLPIWIADYVIGSYGTGAVMAVPAHDERDFKFAREHGLTIKVVILPKDEIPPNPPASRGGSENATPIPSPSPTNVGEGSTLLSPPMNGGELTEAFTEYGIMANSGEFDGLTSEAGIAGVGKRLEEVGLGKPTITWHLRDWTISRQRYWGAPIPMIHCEKCGTVPVPEKDLPVRLPEDVKEYSRKGSHRWKRWSRLSMCPARSAGDRLSGMPIPWIPSCVPRGTTCDIPMHG
jgi:leucyl-tRNA synthetase